MKLYSKKSFFKKNFFRTPVPKNLSEFHNSRNIVLRVAGVLVHYIGNVHILRRRRITVRKLIRSWFATFEEDRHKVVFGRQIPHEN